MTTRKWRARSHFSWLLLVLAPSSCSSPASNGSSAPVPPGRDRTSFRANWKPGTLVLEAPEVAAALSNPTAVDGVYRFSPTWAAGGSLQPGEFLLLSGVDLVKVDAVDVSSDAIVVTTEPASLVDAATDANVSWDVAADLTQALRTQSFTPRLHLEAAPSATCAAPPDGGPCLTKASFDGMLGNLRAKETLVENTDGSLTVTAFLSFPQQVGSPAVLSVNAKATLKSFRDHGTIAVSAGQLTQASFGLDGVDLDLDLNIGAVAIGSTPTQVGGIDSTFRFPVEVTLPFDLGPLPAYFTIGLAIDLNSTLSSTSSARSHVHYHVGGAFSANVDPTSVTATGKLDQLDGTPPSVMDTETVSTITAGFGVLTEFPRVTFGIGLARLAAAEAYLLGKEEVVINEVINLNRLALIAGNCSTVNADVGAFVGGNLRLAGITFKQEKELYGAVNQVYKGGNPDIGQCH